MYDVKFLRGEYSKYNSLATKDSKTFYFCTDTNQLFLGEIELDSKDVDFTVQAGAVVGEGVKVLTGFEVVDGKIKTGSVADQLLAEVAVSGAAADVSIVDASSKITATNVEDALTELATAIGNEGIASKVTIEENTGSGDVLKTYDFYQGLVTGESSEAKAAKKLGTINIPKDYLVRSATIEVVITANTPYSGAVVGDKYIDFVINTKDGAGTGTESHIYIPVNDLVHPISGVNGSEINVAVDATNAISATVNTIDGAKIIYKTETSEGAGDGESVKAALTRLDGADTVTGSVAKKIKDALGLLDADLDAATDTTITDAEKVAVITGVTEVDGVITAVDSIDVDLAGAATRAKTKIIGSVSDTVADDTIKGVKNYIGNLPSTGTTATTVIGYIDEKTGAGISALDGSATIASETGNVVTIKGGITEVDGVISNSSAADVVLEEVAVTGAAADVSVVDTNNYFNGATVEAVLAELGAALTWGNI